VADAVSAEAARILVEPDPRSIDRDLAFSELGFDSQMTVELSTRLAGLTGLRLPETIGWDCGSIAGLAQYVAAALSGSDGRVAPPDQTHGGAGGLAAIDDELSKVEALVSGIGPSEKQRVADRLRALLGTLTGGEESLSKRIQAASTPDEIFRLIDSEFGES
jgi:4-hydroxybenzoate adenylyltransferase